MRLSPSFIAIISRENSSRVSLAKVNPDVTSLIMQTVTATNSEVYTVVHDLGKKILSKFNAIFSSKKIVLKISLF